MIDEALKVWEMMPKDIKREFLTGPRNFDKIMEKLEIIINEMMADDGPVPMDFGNVSRHDTKSTHDGKRRRVPRTRATTCRATMCVRLLGKDTKVAKEQARKDQTDQGRGIEEKEQMNGSSANRDDGGKKGGTKGSKGSKRDWYGDKDKGSNGNKGNDKGEGKGQGKSDTRCT